MLIWQWKLSRLIEWKWKLNKFVYASSLAPYYVAHIVLKESELIVLAFSEKRHRAFSGWIQSKICWRKKLLFHTCHSTEAEVSCYYFDSHHWWDNFLGWLFRQLLIGFHIVVFVVPIIIIFLITGFSFVDCDTLRFNLIMEILKNSLNCSVNKLCGLCIWSWDYNWIGKTEVMQSVALVRVRALE